MHKCLIWIHRGRGTCLQLAHTKKICISGDRKPTDEMAFFRKKTESDHQVF